MPPRRRLTRSGSTLPTQGSALFLACILTLLAAAAFPALAEQIKDLKQQGYVNDFGYMIGWSASSRIEATCRELMTRTGDQLLVVTVHSTEGLTPGTFADQLRMSWMEKSDARERTVILLASREGRIGVGFGSDFDSIFTRAKLDAITGAVIAEGEQDPGAKLSAYADQIAKALEEAGIRAPVAGPSSQPSASPAPQAPAPPGTPSPAPSSGLDLIVSLTVLVMVAWVMFVVRAAATGSWRTALLLQSVPAVALYLLTLRTSPAGRLSPHAIFIRSAGLVVGMWLIGGFFAALAYWKSQKDVDLASQMRDRLVAGRGESPPPASSPASAPAPGKWLGMRATPASLGAYFLCAGLYGLLSSVRAFPGFSGGMESLPFLLGVTLSGANIYVGRNCTRLLRERPAAIKAVLYISSAFCVLGLLVCLDGQHNGLAVFLGAQLLLNLFLLRSVKRLAAEASRASGSAAVPAA